MARSRDDGSAARPRGHRPTTQEPSATLAAPRVDDRDLREPVLEAHDEVTESGPFEDFRPTPTITGEELVAVDPVLQRHRLALGRPDHVAVVHAVRPLALARSHPDQHVVALRAQIQQREEHLAQRGAARYPRLDLFPLRPHRSRHNPARLILIVARVSF